MKRAKEFLVIGLLICAVLSLIYSRTISNRKTYYENLNVDYIEAKQEYEELEETNNNLDQEFSQLEQAISQTTDDADSSEKNYNEQLKELETLETDLENLKKLVSEESSLTLEDAEKLLGSYVDLASYKGTKLGEDSFLFTNADTNETVTATFDKMTIIIIIGASDGSSERVMVVTAGSSRVQEFRIHK